MLGHIQPESPQVNSTQGGVRPHRATVRVCMALQEVRGSTPLSSTQVSSWFPIMELAIFDLGAAAKCSNGVHLSSHPPSFLSASRVSADGISVVRPG